MDTSELQLPAGCEECVFHSRDGHCAACSVSEKGLYPGYFMLRQHERFLVEIDEDTPEKTMERVRELEETLELQEKIGVLLLQFEKKKADGQRTKEQFLATSQDGRPEGVTINDLRDDLAKEALEFLIEEVGKLLEQVASKEKIQELRTSIQQKKDACKCDIPADVIRSTSKLSGVLRDIYGERGDVYSKLTVLKVAACVKDESEGE